MFILYEHSPLQDTVFLVYKGSSTIIKTAFLAECCVRGSSIQKCVLTIQIESNIYKLVQ